MIKGASLNAFSEQQLSSVGYSVYARVEMEGFKNKPCSITGELMDGQKRSKIDLPPPWTNFDGGMTLMPERITDAATALVWLPDLKLQKPFYIKIEAFDPNGTLLDASETDIVNPQPTPSPTPPRGKARPDLQSRL